MVPNVYDPATQLSYGGPCSGFRGALLIWGMRNLNLHPMSALVGAGVVLLAGVLSAQHVANRFVSVRVLETPTLEVAPHPRDYVRIDEGTPYTVPAEKILVPTAFGWTVGNFSPSIKTKIEYELTANGTFVWKDLTWGSLDNSYNGVSEQMTARIPEGLAIAAGSVVDVNADGSGVDGGVLLGYLVDA